MSDLISRQAAIEALSTITMYKGSIPFDTAVMRIEQLPSIQSKLLQPWEVLVAQAVLPQPEIVRCKDCKWYGRADKRRFYRGMDCLQKRIDTIVPDKDFCSRAERRTDE